MAFLKIICTVCAMTASLTVLSAHGQPVTHSHSVRSSTSGFPSTEKNNPEGPDGIKALSASLETLSKQMKKMEAVVNKLVHNHCRPNPCQNGGRCVDQDSTFMCFCTDGFAGDNCSRTDDHCRPNPCQNGGRCVDQNSTFTCFCTDGFAGDNCSISQRSLTPRSCQDIYSKGKRASGMYKIDVDGQGSKQVYCHMSAGGGWMRVANINASGNQCPHVYSRVTSPVPVCTLQQGRGCRSAYFNTHGVAYSEVRGYAYGYQFGSPDAFYPAQRTSINGAYVDGISVTYGWPRKHIWTFAIGMFQNTYRRHSNCPCARYPGPSAPSFVGSDYFCDSGVQGSQWKYEWHNDLLWEGHCHYLSGCCRRSDRPFFTKNIGALTTAQLEVRLCQDSPINDENIGLHQMELFIR